MPKVKRKSTGYFHIKPRKYMTKYGECRVEEYIDWETVIVKFTKTRYITTTRLDDLRNDTVKDYLYPTILNIGYLGRFYKRIDNTELRRKIYKVWVHMLERCYDTNDKGYRNYGGKGITVCRRWHDFTVFFHDFINLPGFEYHKFMNPKDKSEKLTLDKDIFQSHKPKSEQVYSPDTCCLVNHLTQKQYTTGKTAPKTFIAIHPNGCETIETNIRQFAMKHDLDDKAISACILGNCKSHRDYKFKPYDIKV